MRQRGDDQGGAFLVARRGKVVQGNVVDARGFDGQARRLEQNHFMLGWVPSQQLVDQRLQPIALGVQAAGQVARQGHLP